MDSLVCSQRAIKMGAYAGRFGWRSTSTEYSLYGGLFVLPIWMDDYSQQTRIGDANNNGFGHKESRNPLVYIKGNKDNIQDRWYLYSAILINRKG